MHMILTLKTKTSNSLSFIQSRYSYKMRAQLVFLSFKSCKFGLSHLKVILK